MGTRSGDFLIQAGHEGRTSGATGATGPEGNEIDWTPVVADAATTALRNADYTVIRVGADDLRNSGDIADVAVAVSIHFDGNATPCASGASIGYPDGNPPGSNLVLADTWRTTYSSVWPFRWMPDNFTAALSGYYDYPNWNTTVAEALFELGEISCPEQAEWLRPRLEWIGLLIAQTLSAVFEAQTGRPGKVFAGPDPMEEPVADLTSTQQAAVDHLLAVGVFTEHSVDGNDLQEPTLRKVLAVFLSRIIGYVDFAISAAGTVTVSVDEDALTDLITRVETLETTQNRIVNGLTQAVE